MAEINIERKERTTWPWVLLGVPRDGPSRSGDRTKEDGTVRRVGRWVKAG